MVPRSVSFLRHLGAVSEGARQGAVEERTGDGGVPRWLAAGAGALYVGGVSEGDELPAGKAERR